MSTHCRKVKHLLNFDEMEKKLYYELTDNADMSVTATLSDCMQIIDGHMSDNGDQASEIEFTLNPCWLSDKEFRNLPESESY